MVLRSALTDLKRVREIISIAFKYGYGDVFAPEKAGEVGSLPEAAAPQDIRKLPAARRLALMLTEMGTTFIKFGQVLSSRPDLLPPEFITELATLQDSLPPVPAPQVRQVIEASLGRRIEDAFTRFDFTPIATASVAQVHDATLPDGRRAAVKFRRPGIEDTIEADINILRMLAKFLDSAVVESSMYNPQGIIEEFDSAIHQELDFSQEARNLRDFRARTERFGIMVVPGVIDELSTRDVLTMEFMTGEKIYAITDPERRRAVARRLIESAYLELFEAGVFHADPHPGNIMVLPDNRLLLLDLGLVGRLSPAMRETLMQLWVALSLHDAEATARIIYRIAVPSGRVNLAHFRNDIANIFQKVEGLRLDEIKGEMMTVEILSLALRYRTRLPRDFALLGKAAAIFEGLIRTLDPQMDVTEVAVPYAERLISSRYGSNNMQQMLMRVGLRAATVLQDAPLQLDQILLDLESGRFTVNVEGRAVARINHAIRSLGVTVFLGIIAGALLAGSISVLANWGPHPFGLPVVAIIATTFAGIITGLVFGWYFYGERDWRISLGTIAKRLKRVERPAPARPANHGATVGTQGSSPENPAVP